MSLNLRQKKAYRHLANIWTVTRTVTAHVPGDETWTLAYSNVKCRYEYTKNVDDQIDAVGRVKRMTLFTTDWVHFDSAQPVPDGSILKNVTLLPDGTQSPSFGDFHRVLGAPRVTPNAGARRANKLTVAAMTMEHPPATVS